MSRRSATEFPGLIPVPGRLSPTESKEGAVNQVAQHPMAVAKVLEKPKSAKAVKVLVGILGRTKKCSTQSR